MQVSGYINIVMTFQQNRAIHYNQSFNFEARVRSSNDIDGFFFGQLFYQLLYREHCHASSHDRKSFFRDVFLNTLNCYINLNQC